MGRCNNCTFTTQKALYFRCIFKAKKDCVLDAFSRQKRIVFSVHFLDEKRIVFSMHFLDEKRIVFSVHFQGKKALYPRCRQVIQDRISSRQVGGVGVISSNIFCITHLSIRYSILNHLPACQIFDEIPTSITHLPAPWIGVY